MGEVYIYIIDHVYTIIALWDKMCRTTILWVKNSGSVEGLPSRKLKSLWGYVFFRKLFKSNRFQVVVWSQNLRFSYFSFGLIFKRISSQILRFLLNFRFFNFSYGLNFKRTSSQKKGSLARTVPMPSMR